MPCAWLIGHTKVKPHRDVLKDPDNLDLTNLVRLPPLGTAFASAKRHILIINPVTKQIGTLSGDPEGAYRVLPGADRAWLWLAPIEDCTLHSQQGILTPAMRRIEVAEAERAQDEARRREADQKRRDRLARKIEREKEAERKRIERNQQIEERNQTAWNNSPLREKASTLWPGGIPEVLREFSGTAATHGASTRSRSTGKPRST